MSDASDSSLSLIHSLLDQATLNTKDFLTAFATSPDFLIAATTAFGNNFDSVKLQNLTQQWATQSFDQLPAIAMLPATDLNGAKGAFSSQTHTIYLSNQLLTSGADAGEITAVLLEEIGHFVDSKIDRTDASGDEGAIFAALVQKKSFAPSKLQALQTEDDHADLLLNGQIVSVEQAGSYTGTNLGQVKQGLDALLSPLQTALDTLVFANSLPLIGDSLKDSTDPAVDFLKNLKTAIDALGGDESTATTIQQTLFDQLGSWLEDTDGSGAIDLKDIEIIQTDDDIQFKIKLGKTPSSISTPIGFDLGLPGLGLEVTDGSKVKADLGFDFNLSFGVNKTDGFYFNTDTPGSELGIGLDVSVPDFQAKGTLGFLQVDVEDEDRDSDSTNAGVDVDGDGVKPTDFAGKFGLNLEDADGKLTIADLAAISPTDLVDAKFTGNADVNLHLTTSFAGSKVLPSIGTDFHLAWGFTDANAEQPSVLGSFGNAPDVAFNNVSLNLGSFFSDFAAPIVDSIQTFTKPLSPVINFLTDDLPVIKQSLLDIATSPVFAPVAPPEIQDLKKIVDAIKLLNSIPTDAGDIGIQLGSFDLGSADVRSLNPGDLKTILPADVDLAGAIAAQLDAIGGPIVDEAKQYLSQLEGGDAGELKFPILSDPQTVFSLLLGKPDTVLFSYDLPALSFSGGFEAFISILGPLGIRFRGDVAAKIDLAFGYDTRGLEQFASGGSAAELLNGFYVSDRANADGTGADVPEATVSAGLEASAALEAVVASADAGGGIYGTLNLDLDDFPIGSPDVIPPSDGKFRPATELSDSCIFDITGKVTAGLFARLKIGFGPFSYTKRFDLGSTTLLSFEAGCPEDQDDPTLNRDLAAIDPLGSGILQLNMGPRAGLRLIAGQPGVDGSLSAETASSQFDESFAVALSSTANSVNVSAYGITRRYDSVNKIVADGGKQNDAIAIDAAVILPTELQGGGGDDQIYGGSGADAIDGGADNDGLYGGNGNDSLSGGEGDDQLVGGQGADLLIGGSGFDTVSYRDSPVAVTFAPDPANSGFSIGSGGDAEGDKITEVEFIEGSAFADVLIGGSERNTLEGLNGNDVLRGGAENDFLLGDAGADIIDGGDSYSTSESGGTGGDGTSYLTSTAPVYINLKSGYANGGDATGDTLISIEDVQGSFYSDILIGSEATNRLDGFLGDDKLTGGAGADILDGGDGNDWAKYNTSPAAVNVSLKEGIGKGFGFFDGGGGDGKGDRLLKVKDQNGNDTAYSSIENLEGSDYEDRLEGDIGRNILKGLAGDDDLNGDEGNDRLIGGLGADRLDGGGSIDLADYSSSSAAVTINLQAGTGLGGDAQGDTFAQVDGKSTVENLLGSDYADSLTGDAGVNEIDPGLSSGGIDVVNGGDERDRLAIDYSRNDIGTGITGGFSLGSDSFGFLSRNNSANTAIQDAVLFSNIERLQVIGTIKADTIRGGAGDDVLLPGAGNDVIYGGIGNDQILAEDGDDTVIDQNDQNGSLDAFPFNSFIVLDGGRGIDTLSVDLSAQQDRFESAFDINLESTSPLAENLSQRFTLPNGTLIENFEVFKDIKTGGGNDKLTQLGRVDNNFSTGAGDDTLTPGLGFDTVNGGDSDRESPEDDLLAIDYSVGDTGSGMQFELTYPYSSSASGGGRFYRYTSDGETLLDQVQFSNIDRFNITGTSKADFVMGGDRDDSLIGNDGDDGIYGSDGQDQLDGGAGNDEMGGGYGDDTMRGGDGDDLLSEDLSVDRYLFPNSNNGFLDSLPGSSGSGNYGGNDLLDGGAGNDELAGGSGSDQLFGGIGNDFLVGGSDNDSLSGGDGDDTLIGNNSFGGVSYSSEIDTLTGGAGADQFWLGSNRDSYYRDSPYSPDRSNNTNSYALINDFNSGEGDVIQLHGAKDTYFLTTGSVGGVDYTAIYLGSPNPTSTFQLPPPDLIGIVSGTASLSLDAGYFVYA